MSTSTDTPRLLDPDTVARAAAAAARGQSKASTDGVTCPAAVEARKGNSFWCTVWEGSNGETVHMKVLDDQGELSAD
ncbi:DUF4333 domain-containing protein [Streptomyces sp. NBC_01217]|uniref:DUF4333 domain-containing protein n=1 Tax=Streptomyces sp. NBC_01217 TaxID=2903779 RepID=UPI002E150B22|nr:DUF4333 domain-containing protein [Streptomyces sp. NBC_01217]